MTTRYQLISQTSPASATTAASSVEFESLSEYESAMLYFDLQGATGGTLDVYLQVWDGANWRDYYHAPQLAAGAAAVSYALPIARSKAAASKVAIGKDSAPALAADSLVGGDFGDRMRALFVAGAGTSAGAAQVVRFVGVHPSR